MRKILFLLTIYIGIRLLSQVGINTFSSIIALNSENRAGPESLNLERAEDVAHIMDVSDDDRKQKDKSSSIALE
ncbi:hypothetical protein HNP38_000782 [Chryseobacterium defluvii]|uniref:Uncharacterized protein n=1 Tax=Chryseobacterium defluvii TaxID=160396 RepID=A0A840KD91_9FLAO|nr:hypothetical protein [Chryseobacterium defluvii]MBB4805510.1 hypothetical protein [Chryseobacterium defluvii]